MWIGESSDHILNEGKRKYRYGIISQTLRRASPSSVILPIQASLKHRCQVLHTLLVPPNGYLASHPLLKSRLSSLYNSLLVNYLLSFFLQPRGPHLALFSISNILLCERTVLHPEDFAECFDHNDFSLGHGRGRSYSTLRMHSTRRWPCLPSPYLHITLIAAGWMYVKHTKIDHKGQLAN